MYPVLYLRVVGVFGLGTLLFYGFSVIFFFEIFSVGLGMVFVGEDIFDGFVADCPIHHLFYSEDRITDLLPFITIFLN